MRIGRRAGHDDLHAGHVCVERFDRLRVVETAVDSAAKRRANDDRHRPVPVRPVTRARRLADDLVESGVDEVRELDLGDRYEPV